MLLNSINSEQFEQALALVIQCLKKIQVATMISIHDRCRNDMKV